MSIATGFGVCALETDTTYAGEQDRSNMRGNDTHKKALRFSL
jgi:hypothetical protein